MSKNSSKQLVEQIQGWAKWLASFSRRNEASPKKYEKSSNYKGNKPYSRG